MRDESQPSEGQTQYAWIWVVPHPPPLSSVPMAIPAGDSRLPAKTTPTTSNTAIDTDSQDFDRVQWAKCQARAERYEEEVQLTVEEMGRTLRYFEWKRDWWLSLTPERTRCNYPPDVQGGLRAYAHRQSRLYDDLTASFVTHWRAYLSARSLGSSWLAGYASRVDPTPAWPSRGHQKVDAGSDALTTRVAVSRKLRANLQPLVDAPLDSGSDSDSDGNIGDADAEDMEDSVDAEDMFADD